MPPDDNAVRCRTHSCVPSRPWRAGFSPRGASAPPRTPRRQKGGALLAVLWLSAALTAVAFTVAHTVRGETDRAATSLDGIRSYYLATGGIERAMLWMAWTTYRNEDNTARFWEQGTPLLRYQFPTGEAIVEVIPELSKLNINAAPPEDLLRLLVLLGVDPQRAGVIAAAIVDWRTPEPTATALDAYYLSLTPSFRPRHASFQEIEELLLVRGMTPDIYYGTVDRDPEGRLITRPGLRDCVSVFGSAGSGVDINTVEPVVMQAIGIPPDLAAMIVNRRRAAPYRQQDLPGLLQLHPSMQRLIVGGGSSYTLRSTARINLSSGGLSDLRRSVSAQVTFAVGLNADRPIQILRWYDNSAR